MKKIELVPVIEIWGDSSFFISPENGPYWEYAEDYEKAHTACLIASGYESMQSYSIGSNFYELSAISDANLLWEVKNRTEGSQIDEICSFDGGCVLKIDGKDMLFPQCCGSLSDIQHWQELTKGQYEWFWQGHPQPTIKIEDDKIIMELLSDGYEKFVPPPSETRLIIDINDLKDALKETMEKTKIFADRIDKLAKDFLDIDKPSDILVWGLYP
ncbi:hypothetical protein [Bacteroides sp. 519]|uniref:hypothetical protein n=1 Tax=Bacteroides sp. 519 TaxID=2302937 RepID=UPI0013CF5D63|nr:hypothetical protein [Bacteroides sp. 519]NDV58418.1 hypothetical protein [Bacteroides sp. 519]